MYVLGEPPRGSSEAFSILESTFSSSTFSGADAIEAISIGLDVGSSEAESELKRLVRAGSVLET